MKIKNITRADIFGENRKRIPPGAIVDVPNQVGELLVKLKQAKSGEVKKAVKKES